MGFGSDYAPKVRCALLGLGEGHELAHLTESLVDSLERVVLWRLQMLDKMCMKRQCQL